MKIKLHKLFIGCIMVAGHMVSAQNNQILTVTSGYNADVIANGVGSAASSTTVGVDNANYAFMSNDFQVSQAGSTYTNAIPSNGLVISTANSNVRFQFAAFTGNNSLRLEQTGTTGTLEFSNRVMAQRLYVAATGGSGSVTISTIVNFDDGTTQNATGTIVPDWYYDNSLPLVASGIGRVNRNDNGIQNDFGNPRIYMFTINITTANQGKRVLSIQFAKTSAAEGVLNVFAVSADAVACTAPPTPIAEAQEFCGVTTASQLVAAGTVTDSTFRWYTEATGGTALAPTDQVSSGIYFAAQADGSCESTRVPAEVTVNVTPQPEGAVAQSVCIGATLSDVVATGVEGGVITFMYNGTPVPMGVTIESGVYEVTQTFNGCESTPKEITVTVGIDAPVANEQQTLCNGAKVGDLIVSTVEGATVNYYFIGFVPQQVQLTDNLTSGARYSVEQIVNGCTSAPVYIDVTVNNAVAPPAGEPTQQFAYGEAVSDIEFAAMEGNTIKWYILNGSMQYVSIESDTVLEDGMTYYITQLDGTGPCESDYLAVTVSVTTGTDQHIVSNVSVYPNPATTMVNVTSNELISQITVTNLLGQNVIEKFSHSGNEEVNIAALSAGTYLLKVYTTQGSKTVKIVKQ